MAPNKKIAIVGLGYVGLPLAVEFGKVRDTIGFDIDPDRVSELRKGVDKTLELSQFDITSAIYLQYSCKVDDMGDCSVFIVTVPTPIDAVNRPDLSPLIHASEIVSKVLKRGDIVIFESTVFPGCTEEICVPILESGSNLKFNKDFFCGYSPERINPGDKVNTLTKIKKITSGSTPKVRIEVDELYKSIITAGTFSAESIKVAEAAKVIENTQRDLNIALVNELSVIFQRLDIDTIDVLEAAGSKWNFLPFRPGLVGGHCIGVDPYYLTHKAEQVGYIPQVILAGRRINDNMAPYLVKKFVQKMIGNGININNSTVGVLGVTFKENCPDIRNSKVFDVIRELQNWGLRVVLVDPWADSDQVRGVCGMSLGSVSKAMPVASIIVTVGHNEFRQLTPEVLREYCSGDSPVLADVKSIYERKALTDQGFSVFRL
ncbi:nucleotide sugar dehydrogenase [gamma proteobacterium HIMB55]|nr:nucleotide sugar dehydrogenase [gamma proteobacterium HIMB55]